MNTTENNWLTNSNDWEERERWEKIRAERDRKKREFNSLYQLVDVDDYLNWTKKEPRKGGVNP